MQEDYDNEKYIARLKHSIDLVMEANKDLQELIKMIAPDIEWQEEHRPDSPKFKPIIALYRKIYPKGGESIGGQAKTS